MRIKIIVVGEMGVNCYILIDEKSKECIAIDVGAEPERIIKFIEEEELTLKSIVLTHGHYDHIGGCLEVKDKFNVPIIAGESESEFLTNATYNLAKMFGDDLVFKADEYLKDEEEYSVGEISFKTISTPGHTPGGICLYFEKEGVLISGDTLFFCSVGRTDFYMGDTDELLNSLSKLAKLPDAVVVYPGHGQKTTIGFEKANNPYLINN